MFELTGPDDFPHLGFIGIEVSVVLVQDGVLAWHETYYAGFFCSARQSEQNVAIGFKIGAADSAENDMKALQGGD